MIDSPDPAKSNKDSESRHEQAKEEIASDTIQSEFGDDDPSDYDEYAESRPKHAFAIRFFRWWWQRRRWRHIGERPTIQWNIWGMIFLTAVIAAATVAQAYIYFRQKNIMQESLQQNGDALILNRGQLAIANRSALSAETTGADTHTLAEQAVVQAKAANRLANAAKVQAENTELLAKSAQTQAAESVTSANTALKELELSERPWVDAQIVIDGPFAYDVNGAHVTLKMQLLNSGHSVATAANVEPRLTAAFSDGVPSADQLLQDTCKDESRVVSQIPHAGITLFPNHPMEESWTFSIPRADFVHYTKVIPGQFTSPEIVICIGYRASFADEVYHTGYILDLYRTDDNGIFYADFKLGEEIPKDRLRLRCHPSNCIVAD